MLCKTNKAALLKTPRTHEQHQHQHININTSTSTHVCSIPRVCWLHNPQLQQCHCHVNECDLRCYGVNVELPLGLGVFVTRGECVYGVGMVCVRCMVCVCGVWVVCGVCKECGVCNNSQVINVTQQCNSQPVMEPSPCYCQCVPHVAGLHQGEKSTLESVPVDQHTHVLTIIHMDW